MDNSERYLPLALEPNRSLERARAQAIELLLDRGFKHIGQDPMGLPCFRSPSGALLIGVGGCRSLAYAMMGGRLQVVAAARTEALICRIASTPDGAVRPDRTNEATAARLGRELPDVRTRTASPPRNHARSLRPALAEAAETSPSRAAVARAAEADAPAAESLAPVT